MAFKVQKTCTVSKVWERIEVVKAWKTQPSPQYPTGESKSITENMGFHVTIKELGLSLPVGKAMPDVQVGDTLVITLEKP